MKASRTQVTDIDSLEAADVRRFAGGSNSCGTAPTDPPGKEKLGALLREFSSYLAARDEALKGSSV